MLKEIFATIASLAGAIAIIGGFLAMSLAVLVQAPEQAVMCCVVMVAGCIVCIISIPRMGS